MKMNRIASTAALLILCLSTAFSQGMDASKPAKAAYSVDTKVLSNTTTSREIAYDLFGCVMALLAFRLRVEFFSGYSMAAPSVRYILGAIDLHRFHGFFY